MISADAQPRTMPARSTWRFNKLRGDLGRATLAGFIMLGIGGRLLMRVIAHREGRVPAFSPSGTLTVLLAGTAAGIFAGIIYFLLRRLIPQGSLRVTAFIIICGLVAWRGVHGQLLVPQLMFMALAFAYLVVVELLARRADQRASDMV